jgi:hypothetical protein
MAVFRFSMVVANPGARLSDKQTSSVYGTPY